MKCPGQDSRLWGAEAIFEAKCPECGSHVEFFKDESSRKCRKCGRKVLNPKMDFGCATYCRYAAQCLGADMPPELMAKRTELLKDRVAAEVKKALGRDFKRIGRTLKVVDYTSKIVRGENADPAAATLAAYLLSLRAADEPVDEKNGRASDLEIAGILERTGAPAEVSRDVMAILRRAGGQGGPEAPGAQCLSDASRIVRLEELQSRHPMTPEQISSLIEETLITETGKELARQVFGLVYQQT